MTTTSCIILQNQILAMAKTGPITIDRVEFCTAGRWSREDIAATIAAMRHEDLIK